MKIQKWTTPVCPACKILAPRLERIAKEHGIEVEEKNAWEETELADSLGIQSVPTLIFLSEDGEEIGRTVGNVPDSEILKYIE